MSIRDYHDRDYDLDDFPYRRPAISSWIAAAAVAFAFFTLGGFIKTYRQLEALREESRQEIEELRRNVKRLQAQPSAPAPARRPAFEVDRLPDVAPRRNAATRRPDAGGEGGSPLRPARAAPDLSRMAALDKETEKRGVNVVFGNRNPDGGIPEASQVISVSAPKTLMVEGGRDLGRRERDRLALYRDGNWIADIRVVEVFDTMSSCEILLSTSPPQPGDSARRAP